MVIFIALAIALVGFWVGILFENETLMAVCIGGMIVGAFLVLFYTGIESILVLNRDLRTKQSYMLFMLPKSVWEILGAKFISAILQMLIVFGISGIAIGISGTAAVLKIGGVADLVRMAQEISGLFIEGGLQWADLIYLSFVIFLSWTLVIMTGFLSVILARTLLIRSKFAGVLAVIFFFVINFVIERIYELVYRIPAFAALPSFEWNVWDTLFYVLICLLLFGASGMLADRKLSV